MSEKLERIQQIAAADPATLAAVDANGSGEERMRLTEGNYAIKKEGVIHFYLSDDREIFGVDANTFSFEKKIIGAMLQVFLVGINAGRKIEKDAVRQKLSQMINIVFDR